MSLLDNIRNYLNNKNNRIVVNMLIGFLFNYIWSLTKIITGIFAKSLILSISGVYTTVIGVIKNIIFYSYQKIDKKRERNTLILIGILIVFSALTFFIYVLYAFYFNQKMSEYHYIIAIAIAAFSFSELISSIVNLVKSKSKREKLIIGLRCSKLASGFFAIVITQIALLGVYGNNELSWQYNFLTGSIASILSIFIGIWLIRYSLKIST